MPLFPSIASAPLQTLHHKLFEQAGLQVQILRLDKVHPAISGNKWMKLQYWLQKAVTQSYSGILTAGGAWSNHVHAAAFACHQMQLGFKAIIKAREHTQSPMLSDVQQWGGEIIYAHRQQFYDEAHLQQLAGSCNYLYIPMGGDGPEGRQGVEDYFRQLQLPAIDYLFCSIGTGTSFCGIAAATDARHYFACNPGINDAALPILMDTLALQYPQRHFEMLGDASLKKFGQYPGFLPEKMQEWYDCWQLPTDIVYTAKMMWLLEKQVEMNHLKQGASILLIHTGGLQGNRSLPAATLNFSQ